MNASAAVQEYNVEPRLDYRTVSGVNGRSHSFSCFAVLGADLPLCSSFIRSLGMLRFIDCMEVLRMTDAGLLPSCAPLHYSHRLSSTTSSFQLLVKLSP